MRAARLAVLAALLIAAPAEARVRAETLTTRPGWVSLRVTGGAPRSFVTVSEHGVALRRFRLGPGGRHVARRLATWTCHSRHRTFLVDAGARGTAIATASTPSCARRLRVETGRRPRAGEDFAIRVRDRWELGGVNVTACLRSAAGELGCRPARVRVRPTPVRFTAPRPGRWSVTVQGDAMHAARRLIVRPVGARLHILAAGDSMMSRVAKALSRRLDSDRVEVGQDIHYGAGISDDFILDWRAQARATVAGPDPPDVVVLFLGGTEGWPFGDIACCGAPWVQEYARRARQIMQTYRRGGAAQVYWLNLPAPANPTKVAPLGAADLGLALAGGGLAPWVRVLDDAALLTPGFVYRYSAVIDGRETILRQADGLHLSQAGARITARLVRSALEADAVLP